MTRRRKVRPAAPVPPAQPEAQAPQPVQGEVLPPQVAGEAAPRAKKRLPTPHGWPAQGEANSGKVLATGELQNVRWERFAQQLALGWTQDRAYIEAGFKRNSRACCVLANRQEIVGRVEALRAKALADATLSIERVVAELEKMAFCNMLDYMKVGDDGQPVLDFTRLTRDQAAAIVEITTDEITSPRNGEVTRRTKFKLADKRGSLLDLGKWLGMYKQDPQDINVKGVIFHMSADDMQL